MRNVRAGIIAAVAASALLLTGCSPDGGDDATGDETITVWTLEDVAERVEAQQAILDEYAADAGVEIELVALATDQLATVLASSAAAGELPDVIGAVPLNSLYQLQTDGVLDESAAAQIVDSLGADTFAERPLALTQSDGDQLGVPSDAWAQLLFYRADLFEAAGLEAPTDYDSIMTAATTLQSPELAGIVAATAPADSFTQQTFEHFALANGCELVDDDAEIVLDSPECVEAIDFYTSLIRDGSVAGNQDADTTRAEYFSGGAGMIVWSSFLLDELAGLRADALPTCPECQADATFLAENTGIVSAVEGPSGSEPASFGEVVSWAVLDGASDGTNELVEYLMGDGYLEWLAIAPEGKVPTRLGTADEATAYADGWKELEAGVDTKALLSSVYPAEVLQSVVEAPESFNRWGLPQGQGALAGAVAGQFVMPGVLSETINSGVSAEDAANQAAEEANVIKEDLGL
ncbi:multiple sugar transport system substrate-binding protein [Agromyces ramosus]|uniref:Multiple sugar transport system substrate-binding protein n=1 Tax=Agromyces ramosus TaxID=33879 RepID=A0A4Q7MED9_9MICO|nr:extracellular solute-binding protein [Agromyces ramosus]RZS66434.1 multiple sugar transport system substrate-binding protein [Agromyces ramosus]